MKTYTIQSNQVRGEERNIIKIDSSQNHSYNFLETKIEYFTQENGTKVFLFYIDGELVKEASINPITNRVEMRSKIHPRDFIQKDMLFDFDIGSTSAVNKYNKREKKER